MHDSERWPIKPDEEVGETPPLRPFPAGAPWTVTTVAVIIWIGNVVLAIITLTLLGQLGGPEGDGAGILALLLVGSIVLGGFCAVKIRSGSRTWRNVTIVLLALNLIAELFSLPLGLIGMAVNGLQIYLLVGPESSQDFFASRS